MLKSLVLYYLYKLNLIIVKSYFGNQIIIMKLNNHYNKVIYNKCLYYNFDSQVNLIVVLEIINMLDQMLLSKGIDINNDYCEAVKR